MRGSDDRSGSLFSYVDLEKRIRPDHPLRTIRRLVDDALASLDRTFADLYAAFGRPSTPPERLLRAMLLQAFYSIRSERLLMERLDYDTLRSKSRCAARTRTRAKREIRTSALPSRQEITSQASAGSESARPSTDW